MTRDVVFYERAGRRATIWMNRPDVLNAIDIATARAMERTVEAVAKEPDLRAVVVRGVGRAFCAGIDLKALARDQIPFEFFATWERALAGLEAMDAVSVAAINGFAIGGGLQLALACDLRLAMDSAVMSLPAVKDALIPGIAPYRLPRLIGWAKAKELILLGRDVAAEEALALGLVSWVVPPERFDAKLDELVEQVMGGAPTAARHCKHLIDRAGETAIEPFTAAYLEAQRECVDSPDMEEARAAIREKRAPRF